MYMICVHTYELLQCGVSECTTGIWFEPRDKSLRFVRTVDVVKLREDLLLKLQNERSEEVGGLRAKQKQVRPGHAARPER